MNDNRRQRPSATGAALFSAVALFAMTAAACGSDDDTSSTNATDASASTDAAESVSTTPESTPSETDAPSEAGAATDSIPAESAPDDPAGADDEGEDGEAVRATIGVVNLAPVAALELVRDGFAEGLDECAGVDAEIDYRNAEGDGAQLGPIVTDFLDSDVDLILAISTPALQATVSANEADGRETPVLFGAVTDPFAAGAATSPTDKPSWLAGWQADAPVEGMFDIAAEINPDVATIGVAFDPSQVNAEQAVAKMQAEGEARGITVETATIGDSSEVGTAASSLASRDIDFFFVPTDSILVNGLAGMAQVADDNDIPMIAQDSSIPRAGAAIGTGLDYFGDGQRNADFACQILSGTATPADFPIEQFAEELVGYNSSAAEAQGFEIPQSVIDRGTELG